jgi:multidrug efflux pump subunit AcrA (membrane-fusion protein)
MKVKSLFIGICTVVLVSLAGVVAWRTYTQKQASQAHLSPTITTTAKFVNSIISVGGTVTAQSQARLYFQTSGKLVYLPFKEGDTVSVGQTIAQLDTYQLQRQLSAALNTYRATRDSFDQVQANNADNVLKMQQTYPYDYYTRAGLSGSVADTAISDTIKRIADQNQATLDNSVINVELVNYALQLSRLSSPLNGIILHEDVTVPGINITPATTFTVADPDTMVFRANVPMGSIYYIAEGNTVTLAVDGVQDKITGTVTKIYPSKVILANGQSVYQVDIVSDQLKKLAKLDEAGTALISTNAKNVALVPAWTVLGGKYIWIDHNGTPRLQQVTAGKIHGNEIEITKGLTSEDRIIIDPQFISKQKYSLL